MDPNGPRSIAGNLRVQIVRVVIEYDRLGKRVRKEFADNFQARAFFAAKLKAGKNPRVVAAEIR